mmetsp:Transcript_14944/g.38189  ORF Transcript_14944/g.38189 Transcript_14944/m.38189 type:complete len:95 (-) Transcript_14944:58-342(-)
MAQASFWHAFSAASRSSRAVGGDMLGRGWMGASSDAQQCVSGWTQALSVRVFFRLPVDSVLLDRATFEERRTAEETWDRSLRGVFLHDFVQDYS